MCSHGQFGRRLLCLTTACLLLVSVVGPAQARLRHTIGTMLKVTQVRPADKTDGDADKNISKDVRRALRRKFGLKYDAYRLEAQQAREASINQEQVFPLVNGSELRLRVVGYKPSTRLVDLKVQTEDDIKALTVRSGGHLILTFDGEQDPLFVVITVRLLQIER